MAVVAFFFHFAMDTTAVFMAINAIKTAVESIAKCFSHTEERKVTQVKRYSD